MNNKRYNISKFSIAVNEVLKYRLKYKTTKSIGYNTWLLTMFKFSTV